MRWPIDTAVWVLVNLDKRDFDSIHEALLHIAKRLQLSAMDSEQVSMAMRIVKNHPHFLEPDSVETSKGALLASEEGRTIYSVIEEIKGGSMQAM
jgi:predicted lipoprotein with Yx(FWY)xxD motif